MKSIPDLVKIDKPDAAKVLAWLRLFVAPDQVSELRALDVKQRYGAPQTVSGYYDFANLDALAKEALRLEGDAKGVYFTMNPVVPALLARRYNGTAIVKSGDTSSDKDILHRRWLLCDADPVRPAGISASDAEKAQAHTVAEAVRDYLRGLDWPAPIFADSGNGYHSLFRIDLPCDDGGIVERCLQALDARFTSDKVKIDTSVFNPARITKLYGTLTGKGDPQAAAIGRPHRRSAILEAPDVVEVVPAELLQALAAEAPAPAKPAAKPASAAKPSANGRASNHRLQIPVYLNHYGRGFREKDQPDAKGRAVYVLEVCPFDASHGGDSCIMQSPDGQLSAHCFHDGCRGRGWKAFRDAIGKPHPDHYDPPLRGRGAGRKTATDTDDEPATLWNLYHFLDNPLGWLTAQGVEVEAVQQFSRAPASYVLCLAGGDEVDLASADDLLDPRKFQARVMMQTQTTLRLVVTVTTSKGVSSHALTRSDWEVVARALISDATVIDCGCAPADELRDWVEGFLGTPNESFLASDQVGIADALDRRGSCLSADGVVYLRLDRFFPFVKNTAGAPISRPALAQQLKRWGWTRQPVDQKVPRRTTKGKDGKIVCGTKDERCQFRAWVSPTQWWDKELPPVKKDDPDT
jgi:hypothetical protein